MIFCFHEWLTKNYEEKTLQQLIFFLYLIIDGTNIFVFERSWFYKTNVHFVIFCEAMNSLISKTCKFINS